MMAIAATNHTAMTRHGWATTTRPSRANIVGFLPCCIDGGLLCSAEDRLADRAIVVDPDRPEVGGDGDADAPGDRGNCAVADRAAGQQLAYRIGYWCEGLI